MESRIKELKYTLRNESGTYKRIVLETELKGIWGKDIVRLPKKCRDLQSQGWTLLNIQYSTSSRGGSRRGGKNSRKKKKSSQKGSGLIPIKFDCDKYKDNVDVQRIVDLLKRWTGSGSLVREKTRHNLDVVGLMMSYDKGENPLDYLSKPIDKQRSPKILISADFSGSCNADAPFFEKVAKELARTSSLEVYVNHNTNGEIWEEPDQSYEFVLYIGDNDILCDWNTKNSKLHELGCKNTILLSNTACNRIEVRIQETTPEYTSVMGVKYGDIEDMVKALELVV